MSSGKGQGGFLPSLFASEKSLPLMEEDDSFVAPLEPALGSSYSQIIPFEEEEIEKEMQNEEILLYLVRHGEATHNIEEKRAMKEARRVAVEVEGLSENDTAVLDRVEEARKSVLNDETLRDAKLSDLGRKEAEEARDKMQNLIQEKHFPRPDYVLVSPLTRTLETCDILFPNHNDIHVRHDLTERQTGKACDTPSPVISLMYRPSFERFSMDKLSEAALMKERKRKPKKVLPRCSSTIVPSAASQEGLSLKKTKSQPEIFVMEDEDVLWRKAQERGGVYTEEDKLELRKRTERLFGLLCEANKKTIAVVTHKGYLRELERGPFNLPDAPIFKNCEMRVYRVTMKNDKLVEAERIAV